MKILLRQYGRNWYVWKDAKWDGGYYRLTDDGNMMSQTAILAIKDDERIGHVQCANCGKLIPNNPESIEAHYAETEAKKDCMKCDKLVTYGDKIKATRTFTDNGDGTYSAKEEYTTLLGCRMSYYTERLNTANANKNCKFAKCRRSGMREINDIFIQYPNLFDKFITVDTLTAKKYTFDQYVNGFYEYDLKMRGTVKACVNDMGIVDHFVVYNRGWSYVFYYSNRYNKLFFYDYHRYSTAVTEWITHSKEAKILEKLVQLYEEAKTNE